MSPAMVAAAGLVCYLVGWRGLRMVRTGPAVETFVVEEEREPSSSPSLFDRILDGMGGRLSGFMLEILGEQRQQRIAYRLALAGYPDDMTVETFAGRKGAWTVLMAVPAALLVLMEQYVSGIIMVLIGWFLVDLAVRRQGAKRQGAIARDLPDFLDIVGVTIVAGASFRGAMQRVASELPGPLSDEVLTALRQMDIGASRRVAFEGLRDRTNVEALDSFVSALLQAEELGAPLADTLRGLARDMRTERAQVMRKKAAETAPKISLVVIMFIVPATLMLAVTGIFLGADFNLGHLSPAPPTP